MLVGRPTDSLSITAGVRHDDHRDFGGATTFAVDAGQKLGDLVTLRASSLEGFTAPTLYQLSATAGAFGHLGPLPERARGYEVGLRFSAQQGWVRYIPTFQTPHSNSTQLFPTR